MRTFSSLVGRSVETESGLHLGRCHDLKAELGSSRLRVTEVCFGGGGIADRLGIRIRGRHDEVRWSAIVRIDGERIVVRDP